MCDVIVYDLITNSFEEVDYVIKTLKTSHLLEQKTLILLSTIMTWVNTPPKYKKELAEGEEEEGQEQEPEEEEDEVEEEGGAGAEGQEAEEELDENGEPIKKPKPIFYKENDRHLRVPDPAYQNCKTLETIALSSVQTQPMLKVHVLCSGIRYGMGEE
mmetsp:Transcript_432/g.480  ORF Transcript_432/g.480 Transcript_432/m.480 type:complete len:158 (-) Transcript_432:1689-2162(-)